MAYEERIFVVGGTGNIGKLLVRKFLSSPKVSVTLYVRSPSKVQQLYGDYPDDKLRVIQGDYDDQKPFKDAIAGHTRLFLLIRFVLIKTPDPKAITAIAHGFAEKAYAAGVQQIVCISSICASMPWRSSILTDINRQLEESILSIPNRKSAVMLRPGQFMSNQLYSEYQTFKSSNKIYDTRDPNTIRPWISSDDVAELAARILQDPVDKHYDAVYEMVGDPRTPTEQAKILSRVLGRTIVYEQVTDEQQYETLTKESGMSHTIALLYLQLSCTLNQEATPGLSVLLGRPPQSLEQWVEQNKSELS